MIDSALPRRLAGGPFIARFACRTGRSAREIFFTKDHA